MTYFLDENDNIPDVIPKKHRQFAYSFAMNEDNLTLSILDHEQQLQDPIRCHATECKGAIQNTPDLTDDSIVWECDQCGDNGRIYGWQGTKWEDL